MSAWLGAFHFLRPAAWLLAPLALGIWWLWRRSADPLRGWREQIEPELLRALVVGAGTAGRWRARGVLAAWLLAITALAGPTWRLESSPFGDDATPLMVLLEADASMELPDPPPSRLRRAHLKIADLAAARVGQPLGLVAYAGSAHLVLPPTRDTAAVASMAAEIDPTILPVPGDRLDLALREGARVLDEGGQGGSLVVLADGVATELAVLRELRQELSFPVQILAVLGPDAPEAAELRDAARALGATLEPLDLEGGDVEALVRRAARAPLALRGEQAGRWEEAGYGLVPLLALLVLASFRRERNDEVAA